MDRLQQIADERTANYAEIRAIEQQITSLQKRIATLRQLNYDMFGEALELAPEQEGERIPVVHEDWGAYVPMAWHDDDTNRWHGFVECAWKDDGHIEPDYWLWRSRWAYRTAERALKVATLAAKREAAQTSAA